MVLYAPTDVAGGRSAHGSSSQCDPCSSGITVACATHASPSHYRRVLSEAREIIRISSRLPGFQALPVNCDKCQRSVMALCLTSDARTEPAA